MFAQAVASSGTDSITSATPWPEPTRLRMIRARRRQLEKDPAFLRQVLADGNRHADEVAEDTLQAVEARMHMTYY